MIGFSLALAFLVAQDTRPAPALTPELLFAHPGLFSGDYAEAREDWLRALEAEPHSPLAFPALVAISSVLDYCADPLDATRIRELRAAVDDGRALATLIDFEANLVTRSIFGPSPLPAVERSDLDCITSWFVMGPAGPLDDWWPLWRAGADDEPHRVWRTSLPSSFGTELEWLPLTANGDWINPEEELFPIGGVAYMVAWIDADLEEAQIEVTTGRALEVFWNGQLVARELRGGPTRRDTRVTAPVRFAPQGPNALVLRVESGEFEGLRVRVLDHDGSVHRGSVAQLSDLSRAPSTYPSSAPAAALLSPALGSGPLAPLTAMALALADNRPDRALAVAVDWDALSDEAARAAWLRVRHRALLTAWHLPGEVSRRLRIEVEERAAALSLRIPEIEMARAARLVAEDRPQEGVAIARALVEEFPHVPLFHAALHDALEELDATGVLANLARADSMSIFDDAASHSALSDAAQARVDPVAALAHARRAAAIDGGYGYGLLRLLADGTEEEQTEALEWIAKWRAADPTAQWLEGFELRIFANKEQHALVEAALRSEVAESPHVPQTHLALADHLRVHGAAEDALHVYQRVLELEPGNSNARAALTALGVEDPAAAFFRAHAPDREAAIARARAFDQQVSTALVLEWQAAYFRTDGTSRVRYHRIHLAVDRTGTEVLHEQSVLGEPIVQRVIAPDGTVFEPGIVDGSWVMPALDPGSLVETVFEYDDTSVLGAAPWLGDFAFASFEEPHLESRVALFLPDGLPGDFVIRNFDGSHTTTPVEGGVVHVFESRDRALLLDEPLRPSDGELVPWIDYGADANLDSLATRHMAGFADRSDVAADVEVELREFLRGVRERTDAQFLAEALHAAVCEHVIDFNGGGDTTDVWTLKRGDPLGLLAALYDLASIEFEWVMTQPGAAPALIANPAKAFFDASDFGYAGLRLAPTFEATEPTWLLPPPGVRGHPFGRVPSFLGGASVVVFGEDGPRRESLPVPEDLMQAVIRIELRLQPDKSAIVEARIHLSDVQGPMAREAILQSEPNQRAQIAQRLAPQFVTGIDLENWNFEGLEQRGNDLVLVVSGRINDFVKGTTARPHIRAPWPRQKLSAAFGRGDRRWPVALRNFVTESSTVRVVPCETWTIDAAVARTVVQRPGLEYVLDLSLDEDGVMTFERRFALTGLELTAAEAASFAAELKSIEDLDNARIELVPVR